MIGLEPEGYSSERNIDVCIDSVKVVYSVGDRILQFSPGNRNRFEVR